MYATVYFTQKVVHVADRIPAMAILGVVGGFRDGERKKTKKSLQEAQGAVKTPAYDHFLNFSGKGVFTSEGTVSQVCC